MMPGMDFFRAPIHLTRSSTIVAQADYTDTVSVHAISMRVVVQFSLALSKIREGNMNI